MKTVDIIIELRDAISEAHKIKCTCSSFVLQVQGCGCDRSKQVENAKFKFWDFINNLK